MLCDQCREREAVIHLTQIVNDQVTTLHLCERCAAEKGVESSSSMQKTPVGNFLAAMGKGLPGAAAAALPGGETGTGCTGCGATLQDFRETGRLGCAECYRAFEAQLRDLLRRLHGATTHVGERYAEPGRPAAPAAPVPVEPPRRLVELREQLRVAVESENFELAAELRDRLRGLE